jgi:hypothetical protein
MTVSLSISLYFVWTLSISIVNFYSLNCCPHSNEEAASKKIIGIQKKKTRKTTLGQLLELASFSLAQDDRKQYEWSSIALNLIHYHSGIP